MEEAYAGGRTLGFGPAGRRRCAAPWSCATPPSTFAWPATAASAWARPTPTASGTRPTSSRSLRVAALEMRRSVRARRVLRGLGRPLRRLRPDAFRNTVAGARRNIAAHYDLGNDLFELFLDRDLMVYSCGLYAHSDDTLEDAQRAKVDRVCRALALGPHTHLLEIGGGWGGLAMHAAAEYGARVTTTTISAEQRAYAEARIQRAGLDDRVRVIGQDYRELEGTYDRLASIEMIEAVGWQYFDDLLRPLLGAAGARRAHVPAGDLRRRPRLRGREGRAGLRQPARSSRAASCPRSRPSRGRWPRRPTCVRSGSRTSRPRTCSRCAPGANASSPRRSGWPSSATTGASGGCGSSTSRSRRPGFAEARIMDVQMLCAKPRWRSPVGGAVAAQETGRGTALAHR